MQRFLIAAIAVGVFGIAGGSQIAAPAAEATGDAAALGEAVLFEDRFDSYRSGPLFSPVGAHAEYHYVREIAPAGPWAVSAFSSDADSQRAWNVRREDGRAIIEQRYRAKTKHTHPTLVAGDEAWTDYVVTAEFAPGDDAGPSGVSFRYQNDRCYYWFGVVGRDVILKKVEHERDYHVPDETILAQSRSVDWTAGEYLAARIVAAGNHLEASLAQGGRELAALSARDASYRQGKVALVADVPVRYRAVRVTTSKTAKERFEEFSKARAAELAALEAGNPRPVRCKKIRTTGFGVGRNLRFGDLNGDGQVDVLIGQVVHHGPKDRNSELSCLTAMTFDGETLWQVGDPDAWKDHLTNDVGFQIHDLDGDGRNEVIYCRDFEIVVADGATGKTKYKAPTPETKHPQARYDRILGDSLFFCDIRGTGHPRDVVVKDRYWQFWVLSDRLEVLWRGD